MKYAGNRIHMQENTNIADQFLFSLLEEKLYNVFVISTSLINYYSLIYSPKYYKDHDMML